ncbi:phosphoribosylanthranilate isomerase [Sneathiella sp. CAU 1612]|jgi:phosphoribosylanthranilate isomerase|uniref:N-(5'-phosphoribosyl)anthranilate isomerase n=1 Tax=Sneathiella sedimenti TaxID=2816034 RepID=A0ABS3F2N9_9PROT|nr:phosphoribosylanthranilate isomerase [Sneathiella sedimenti]MBO0332782.1 phosphoribosylanthranilate isomerase [Sneathiella sedimenti]
MTIQAKICGLSDVTAVEAAVLNGAAFVGFVFYGPSPRNITPDEAALLTAKVPSHVKKVGLFVDPDEKLIRDVLTTVSLDWIQLHGSESPERVREIRDTYSLPVIKAIKIDSAASLDEIARYDGVADMLLFDAKEPKSMKNALPGGNGLAFDWDLLANATISSPWMLAGGLTAENIAEAVRISGAKIVDTSSGVEFEPGRKNPAAIEAFMAAVAAIDA